MYLNLVREIKTAITNSENLPDEFLVELASEYGQACESVNRQLVKVIELLKIGCRDEAVQVADYPRSVLESVRELNFKERKDWVETLADKNLEVPPRLDFPLAVQLEKAYEKMEELAPLLKKNRLLALAQAPLRARIFMLDKLAEADPENPIWKADSIMLQEARLAEIREHMRRAKKAKDGVALRELYDEVHKQWDVEVPPALISDIATAVNSVGLESFRNEMKTVAEQLNDCLVAMDAEAAQPLRQRWMQLNQTVKLAPDDDLAKSVSEAMAWLNGIEQQRQNEAKYQRSAAELERALQIKAPVEQIDRCVSAVDGFQREDAGPLLEKAAAYRKAVVGEQRRQTQVVRYVVIGFSLAAVLAAGAFFYSSSRTQQINESRKTMKRMMDEDTLASVKAFYQSLPEFVQQDSEIAMLHSKLVGIEQQESDRVAAFERIINNLDLSGDLGPELNDVLEEGRELAQTPAEKQQIDTLKTKLAEARTQRQAQRTEVYLKEFTAVKNEVDVALMKIARSSAMPSVLPPLIEKINQLKANASQVQDGMPGISLSAKMKTDELIKRAKTVVEQDRQKRKSAEKLAELKERTKKLRGFGDALQKFSMRYPDNPNARGFKLAAGEKNHWRGMALWQGIAEVVANFDIDKMDEDQLIDLQDDISEATELTTITNWSESQEELGTYLNSLLGDRVELEEAVEELREYFQQNNYSKIHVVQRDGDRYYLTHDFDRQQRKFSHFVRGINQRERRYLDTDTGGLAGHCVVAERILKDLDSGSAASSEVMLKMLESALVESSKIETVNGSSVDPLVQCDFVYEVLEFIESNSPVLKAFARGRKNTLNEAGVVGLDWRNVENVAAGKNRDKAQATINAIRQTLGEARRAVADRAKKMEQWTQIREFQAVGLIYRLEGRWIADTTVNLENERELYCLIPARGSLASLEKVGVYRNGTIDQGISVLPLQAGRPIFVRETKRDQ